MSTFHNRTRRTASIPRRLVREGKLHLLPVYYLGLTTALGKEAIENSGSYDFADHIYGNRPAGKFLIGYLLDALFLNLKSARSFRSRYLYSRSEIQRLIVERADPIDVLAVPCGLARELFDVAAWLAGDRPTRQVRLIGMDLDEELTSRLAGTSRRLGLGIEFVCGDALSADAYPAQPFDGIVSLGFTEFLDDSLAAAFYRLAHDKLKPGGRLVTSGMRPHKLADYLLRNVADLQTSYRSAETLRGLARQAGFEQISTYEDPTGLQTMLIGVKQP
ncbi:MAG TPA: class I SAM-dependent methyltransferase [Candidatus Dormibacteraeota bacterium]|nr:class I SAM-dependent methyltransferase [Candidatus Dormibacteraeota bacterium]